MFVKDIVHCPTSRSLDLYVKYIWSMIVERLNCGLETCCCNLKEEKRQINTEKIMGSLVS